MSLLSFFYGSIMRFRNWLYDQGILKVKRLGVPVISIGNLSVGGTGKTPMTLFLAKKLKNRGPIGIVSRGYKRQSSGVVSVELGQGLLKASRFFGDEPTMFKWLNPELFVQVGAKRYEAGKALLGNTPGVRLILADDAFQHRQLYRNLNLLLVDATCSVNELDLVPVGRGREPIDGVNRADYIFLTKSNLAGDMQLVMWMDFFKKLSPQKPVACFSHVLSGYSRLSHPNDIKPFSSFNGRRVLLVSGIGNPKSFQRLVENVDGPVVVNHLEFSDHKSYGSLEIQKMIHQACENQVVDIFMTEKDAVKLVDQNGLFVDNGLTLWMTRLEVQPFNEYAEEIIDEITSLPFH